jgi:hypothetical protein
MHQVLRMIAVSSLMLAGTQALAADPAGHAKSSRRQSVNCIIKRMSASRTVSFNEATKACKDQMKAQGDLASNTLADTSAKPVNSR